MAKRLEEGDEERGRYLETLENGYRFNGYVSFDKERATNPIAKNLELDAQGFIDLMIKYLRSGGRLDRVDESRPDWKHWRFHFDLWPELAAEELYVEPGQTRDHRRERASSGRCHVEQMEQKIKGK